MPVPVYPPTYNRMKTRSAEMLLATYMAAMGAVFLIPGRTLDLAHWRYLSAWVDKFPGNETNFGALLLVVGVARFCAVMANGEWVTRNLWYPGPLVRLIFCAIGSLFWTSITVSFLSADISVTSAAVAWSLPSIVWECHAATRVAVDAHAYDTFGMRRRRRERASRN